MSLKNWDNKTWLSSKKYIKSFNNFLLKQIRLNRDSQILDIGCGRGKILGFLCSSLRLKNKPVGIDIETAVRCNIPILTIIINNAYMSIYDDRRFPVAVEKYNIKQLSGEFTDMCTSLGAFAQQVTEPNEIIPAITRAIQRTEQGQPAVLEFMTRDEGEYSKFTF